MAKINLKQPITLQRDDGTTLELPAGEQNVDKDVAAHWFVKGNLVGAAEDDEDDKAENEAKAKDAAKGKTTSAKSTG